MPGVSRRNKPLKAKTLLADITDFSLSNAANGDVLVFDSSASLWKNTKTLTGDYSISGELSLATLLASGLVAFSDDLTVTKDFTVSGSASLQGTAVIGGAATLSSTLSVSGAVTLSDALTVTGTLSGAGFSFSGNGTVTGTLGVTGVLAAAILTATEITTTGAMVAGSSLVVLGTTVLAGDLLVNANISAGSIAATSLSTTGNFAAEDILAEGTLTFGGASLGVLMSHDAIDAIFHNQATSGKLTFTALQTDGATTHTLLTLDPDAEVELFHNTVATAKTAALASGGFLVNNTLTGGGYERVLTIGDGLHSLTDVTLTTPVTGGLLVKSSGDWIDSSNILVDDANRTISFQETGFDKHTRIGSNAGAFEIRLNDFNDLALLATVLSDVTLFFDGLPAFVTAVNGGRVRDTSGSDPLFGLASDADVNLAVFQIAGTVLFIDNRVHGGPITLRGEDNAGSAQTLFSGDPDGAASLFHNGTTRLATTSSGAIASGTVLDLSSGADASTILRALNTKGGVSLDVVATSGDGRIGQRSTIGALDATWINMVRAGEVSLFHDGTLKFETTSAGAQVVGVKFEVVPGTGGTLRFNLRNTEGGVQMRVDGDKFTIYQTDLDGITEDIWIDFLNNSSVSLYYDGTARLATTSSGVTISGDESTLQLARSGIGETGRVGLSSGAGLIIHNANHSGTVLLRGEDSGGNNTNLVVCDPDGSVDLWYDGSLKFVTQANGVSVTGNLDVSGEINGSRTNGLIIDSTAHGMQMLLRAEDNGGTIRVGLSFDPDGGANMYYNGVKKVSTTTSGADIFGRIFDIDNSSSADTAHLVVRNNEGGARFLVNAGGLQIKQVDADGASNAENWIVCTVDAGVSISYNNSEKFETTATGARVDGLIAIGDQSQLTIVSGVVVATQGYHDIDTQSDASSDELDTITFSGTTGSILVIQAESSSRTIVCKDSTGNLHLAGDFSLLNQQDKLVLIWNGGTSFWQELSRSTNVI